MNHPTHLTALRSQMTDNYIDMYIIPTSDFHSSEYVGDYFKSRAFVTGFSGSAGVAVVTKEQAYLWTDGRYFIQAERQIKNSGFQLMKMGVAGVPTVTEFVEENLGKGQTLGYDGRCITMEEARSYRRIASEKHAYIYDAIDLVGEIWADRPQLPKKPVWVLADNLAGMSVGEKVSLVKKSFKEKQADAFLLSSLYDIAWLLNLRGDDIEHVPVFLSYVFITDNETVLYAFEEAFDQEARSALAAANVQLKSYDSVFADMASLDDSTVQSIFLDPRVISTRLEGVIPSGIKRIEGDNPTELLKAVKNDTEIANTKEAHIQDGVAVTKFIYWLKTNIGKTDISETEASEYLLERRRELDGYLDVSFDTIAAYGANAAMMHYTATEESYSMLKPEGFLLVDSGGHYKKGTTDITRTIVLGPVSEEMIRDYTTVLRSNLRLAEAHFIKGCIGQNLDILARGPVWDLGLDYRCGTGHGVGHILNVHEGPNAFRWKVADHSKVWEIVPGMITTDEPGLYIEDAYGIRIENELLCVEDQTTEYGTYYKFEPLTWVPIDLDAVDASLLTQYEKKALNDYHKKVYEKISPYLTEEEKKWLAHETREV